MADQPDPPESDDVAALRHEAAQRRRELRAAEAERDSLRERVVGYERDAVNRLAGERLANAEDLLLAVSLDDLRDDSGAVSAEKASAAIDAVLEQRPHWRKAEPEPELPRHPDVHNGARAPAPEPPLSFGTALKNSR